MLALLTEEQEMLQQTAAQLASSVTLLTPSDVATVDRAKAWAALGEAGLLALRTRDGDGAVMASGVEVMLVAQALGAALAPLPYVGSIVACDLLSRAGAPAAWIDPLAAGEVRYGLLLDAGLGALAESVPDAPLIAFDVDEADYVVALSRGGSRPNVVRVPLGSGFAPADSADLTRVLLRAQGGVPAGEDAGLELSHEAETGWLALALVTVSADAIGVMTSALNKAVEYAKERVQYGVKIGSFQAVQHLCADAFTHIEAAASLTRYAAWAVDALEAPEALVAARVAKAYASSVARDVTETVMQVFGGIGQTWEHIAHLHTRRALLDRVLLGDESTHLLHIADARLSG